MKLLLASFALVLVSPTASSAAADTPALAQSLASPAPAKTAPLTDRWSQHVERARQFATLTVSGERLVESIHAAVMQAAMADLPNPDDPRQQAYAAQQGDDVFGRAEPQIRGQIPALRTFYGWAYAREFTEDEMKQILAVATTSAGRRFAATPTGKRYAARIHAIEADPIVVAGYDSLQAEASQYLNQAKREACARRAQARIAAGDANAKCSMG